LQSHDSTILKDPFEQTLGLHDITGAQALLHTHLRWPQHPWASRANPPIMVRKKRVPVMGVPPWRKDDG